MRYILLDANIIIYAFDSQDNNSPQHREAKEKIRAYLRDDQTKLAITPLIRYEVLRGVKTISADDMQAILNGFEEFNINEDIAMRCAALFHAMSKPDNLSDIEKKNYKHNFDLFHYAVAETYQLELDSDDSDLKKIMKYAESVS